MLHREEILVERRTSAGEVVEVRLRRREREWNLPNEPFCFASLPPSPFSLCLSLSLSHAHTPSVTWQHIAQQSVRQDFHCDQMPLLVCRVRRTISSDMSAKKRHESMRAFQLEGNRAKVSSQCVSGTAASLSLPRLASTWCIHRFVKRFASRESYEVHVCHLHDEIRAGEAVTEVNGEVSAATIKNLVNSEWSKRKVCEAVREV